MTAADLKSRDLSEILFAFAKRLENFIKLYPRFRQNRIEIVINTQSIYEGFHTPFAAKKQMRLPKQMQLTVVFYGECGHSCAQLQDRVGN
ncbi:hypothetical protein [Pseudovibrio denitrificans]|uniref:hypothetical protein n=1 Tax=Pseudovibrio denitrificans TaxID=258256 RepID=UPI0013E3CF64|nr:hypothetical protein [Pseudovibrio denitrificans]